ncbi:glycoside hydrolase family 2 TIM barrel-domain containing protein [Dyadobacter helix]|uniref:glycoside hydrolase family 2 TIM barrel-domain containing protein n=1 Tax=Dyadobacter helix TaxID=2822344 RepID=UPI001E2B2080|nr:glycoside hydrolase family 2 TIM barrel-domain containing protein [Dyadobacter sp. CECT 9275]
MNRDNFLLGLAGLRLSVKKIAYSIICCACLYVSVTLLSCKDEQRNSAAKVRIVQSDNGYAILRNGKVFEIKGASGTSNFQTLHEAGGNCLRVWDTLHLRQILDSAYANDIAVIAGLPIQNSDQTELYNDPIKTLRQLSKFQSVIDRHKNHPALLMWCLGNELDFPYKPSYNSFYAAFNAITKMIRRIDPDHPITTTVMNFNKKYITNIQLRCDIDVVSFNIFSNLGLLRKDLSEFSWFWNGPYMLLEWGTDGPWPGCQSTAWGAFIEYPSKKKADIILHRYRQHMPLEDPRLIGNFIFFWGSKQETTHTWFSIFDEHGRKSEPVAIMQYIWKRTLPDEHYPQIRYMLLNHKGAGDNILLNPGQTMLPELVMHDKDSVMSVNWEIFKEDWYKENGQNNTRKLIPLDTKFETDGKLTTLFKSPMEEGPYRIFAKIYDYNGNFATCNTPFYVMSDR